MQLIQNDNELLDASTKCMHKHCPTFCFNVGELINNLMYKFIPFYSKTNSTVNTDQNTVLITTEQYSYTFST